MQTTRRSGEMPASPCAASVDPPASPCAESVEPPSDVPTLRPDPRPLEGADRYEILGEQGRGGLGRVLRARDRRLERLVALKELVEPTREAAARFVREVMLTARLQHPAIISIYEIGERDDGSPFYAMKLVEGRPLDEVIASAASLEERLGLVSHAAAVADAIAYAHDHGIIHRDLKPANVIVGSFGETVVIDWGLAKDLRAPMTDDDGVLPHDGSPSSLVHTRAGELLGTPAYMPPEQMRGTNVDERADVFALGGILYHVLTGRAPYDTDSFRDAVGRILVGKPVPMKEREPRVPAELAAIVDKAMAPAPGDRYSTAKGLAADLSRYRTGQLVAAHRYTPAALAFRFVKKHKAAFALTAAFVVALAVTGALAVKGVMRERDRAEVAREEAEARTLDLTMIHARSALDRDPTEAVAWVRTYPSSGPAWREVATIAAEAEHRGVARWVHELFPRSWVRDMRVSNDGRFAVACDEMHEVALIDLESGEVAKVRHPEVARWVAFVSGDRQIVAAGESGGLMVFDRTGERSRELGAHPGGVRALAVLPSGDRVVTGGQDGQVRVFDIATGATRVLGSHEGAVDQLVVTAAGKVASTSRDGSVRFWDASNGSALATHRGERGTLRTRVAVSRDGSAFVVLEPKIVDVGVPGALRVEPSQRITVIDDHGRALRSFVGHEGLIDAIDISPDGRTVASGGLDHTVRLWDVATGASRVLHGHTNDVGVVRFSPDGRTVASSGLDGDVRLWDAASGESVRVFRGHARNVIAIGWTTSSRTGSLVSADQGGVLRVWPLAGDPHRILAGHTHDIVPMVFSPSGARIVTGSNDKTMRIWDLASAASEVRVGHGDAVRWLAFARNDTIVSGGLDNAVRAWPMSSASEPRTFGIGHPIHDLAAVPTSDVVAIAAQDGARVVDLVSGSDVALRGHDGAVRSVAMSSDGRLVATGGEDRSVRLWDAKSGARVATLAGHTAELGPVVFSRDGARLASGDRDGIVRVWDVASHAPIATLRGHDRRIVSLDFAPDGAVLASGSNDHTVRVWDVAGGRSLATLPHEDHVAVVTFSPDGTLLASGGNDATVRLWDRSTLALRALHHQGNVVTAALFSPDGRTLASTGWDRMVRLWPVDPSALLPIEPAALRARLEALTNAPLPKR